MHDRVLERRELATDNELRYFPLHSGLRDLLRLPSVAQRQLQRTVPTGGLVPARRESRTLSIVLLVTCTLTRFRSSCYVPPWGQHEMNSIFNTSAPHSVSTHTRNLAEVRTVGEPYTRGTDLSNKTQQALASLRVCPSLERLAINK